jgi:hypothetical protein
LITLHFDPAQTDRINQALPRRRSSLGRLYSEGKGSDTRMVWVSDKEQIPHSLDRTGVTAARLERVILSRLPLQVGEHDLVLHRDAAPCTAEIQDATASRYMFVIPLKAIVPIPALAVLEVLTKTAPRLLLMKQR